MDLSENARNVLEVDTRKRRFSHRWFDEKRIRLTASNFGQICKMRPTTSCKTIVSEKLNSPKNNFSKKRIYEKNKKPSAIEYFKKKKNVQVNQCGLFIDDEYPFLGASSSMMHQYLHD